MLGRVNPVSAVASALAALDAAEDLGAVVDRDDSAVREQAEAADRSSATGALAGRTVTVKDWIDVTGFVCEGIQQERTGRRPTRDATAVARLRSAGAVVVAKTQPGADHAIHGRCHHPLDATRTPGGSSSGEVPAAWCGVVGFKPSFGLVPTTGHFPRVGNHADGRTVIGPMATSVADAASALSVIAGPDGIDPGCCPIPVGDAASVRIEGLRVGVLHSDERWPVGSSTSDAVARAVACLVRHGAIDVGAVLALDYSESFDITRRYWTRASLTGAECEQQLGDWDRFAGRMLRAAAGFDVLLGPVVADVAPPRRELVGDDYVFTLPWSLTGWPALSLPFGVDPSTDLPLAVQIAAPRWRDHVVLAAAAVLENSSR